ncbi:oligosaccharide flippase family protein [Flammeovirga agarivorans]|uniref:Oligosaccharide flippase family protein n=1 Tax=Flammeovirga agarivorans TaxID=2726742 RepID=A0A7X8XWV4_9BACT|nr:oligosaccharide flippase family protein [Flammeovirga agarivorans]NLR92658.1 oligosaccharide flippase family protein [Flammeovirga agarivorans]
MSQYTRKNVLSNIFWIFFDKAFILLLKFLVGVKIANHYGADTFGHYQYIASIVGFSPLLYEIINERIVQKFFSSNSESHQTIINSVTIGRFILSSIALIAAFIYCWILKSETETIWIFFWLIINNTFINLFFGIQSFYENRLKARKIVVPVNITKALAYGVINYLITLDVPIVYIPFMHAVGSILSFLIILVIYVKEFPIQFNLKFPLLRDIIHESKFLWISTTAFVIFSQMDKVMLGSLIDDASVGVYSIALLLSTVTQMLLTPIRNTAFPMLLNYKEDKENFKRAYLKFSRQTVAVYLILIPSSVLVLKYTFHLFFVSEYNDCLEVYNLLLIIIFIQAVCNLQTSYLTIYEKTKYLLYKNVIGMIINIILNFILIKNIGIYGAAIATGVTQFATYYVLNFFYEDTRILNKWVLQSFQIWKLVKSNN